MHYLFLLSLFLFSCWNPVSSTALWAAEEPEIVVRLETSREPLPIYIASIASQEAGFDRVYLKQLEQVIRFDFSHNGMTKSVDVNSEMDARTAQLLPLRDSGVKEWLKDGVAYVIIPTVRNQTLSVKLVALNGMWVKQSEDQPLTGKLADDRKVIHKISDALFKVMFSSDGIASTKLLYTVRKQKGSEKDWTSDVWESDYDGANARQLTDNAGYCITPVYLPPKPGYASQNYIYVSYQTGQPKLYLASLKEKKGERITLMRSNQLMPATSPKRNALAFIGDITGNPDLFLLPFQPDQGKSDKPRQIFSAKQAVQASPTFSPDGKKIAFVSSKDGTPRVYVITIPEEGTPLKEIKAELISKLNKDNTSPAWSPDGTKIAYSATTQGVRQIWIYDLATKRERQVTAGSGHKENPSWAPNSLHLVFNTVTKEGTDLFFINLNQPEVTKISSGSGEKRFPSWEPRS